MRKLCYIGEINDYSDKWLINSLLKEYAVETILPQQWDRIETTQADLWINRLYLSSVERFGFDIISALRDKLRLLSPVINSDEGWKLESDRIYQHKFFTKKGFDYISTHAVKNNNINNQELFPLVIKKNTSGRNKILPVFNNIDDLKNYIQNAMTDQLVIQPLINEKICYRTEFVGRYSWTYRQYIKIDSSGLSFTKDSTTINHPANFYFYQNISELLRNMYIKCFSIEYFMYEDKISIVDFNMTSNYPETFINKIGPKLLTAWKEIIQNEI